MKTQLEIQAETLKQLSSQLDRDMIENAIVCEYTSYDNTPTLFVYLWRAFGLSDLPVAISQLRLVDESAWDGGTVYSFQLI